MGSKKPFPRRRQDVRGGSQRSSTTSGSFCRGFVSSSSSSRSSRPVASQHNLSGSSHQTPVPRGPRTSSSRGSSRDSSSLAGRGSTPLAGRGSSPLAGSFQPTRYSRPTEPPCLRHETTDIATSEDEPDCASEIVLALEIRPDGTLGSAYYIAFEERLYVQHDVVVVGMDLVETLLLQAQPTTVLVPNRVSDELFAFLQRGTRSLDGSRNRCNFNGSYAVQTTGSSEFNPDAAATRLQGLALENETRPTLLMTSAGEDEMLPDDDDVQYRSNQFLGRGPLRNAQSPISMGCAGAVMSHLQRRRASEYLAADPDVLTAYRIRSVTTFNLGKSMFVNEDTRDSLQIMRSEYHPNNQMNGPDKNGSGSKESLSVYGLFQEQACTAQGRAKLRQMFLSPSTDMELLAERHRTIAAFVRPENSEDLSVIRKKLGKVKNMNTTMKNLRKGVDKTSQQASSSKGVWQALLNFSTVTSELFEAVCALAGSHKLHVVRKMLEQVCVPEVMRVGKAISDTVDFAQSDANERTVVLRGVNQQLDAVRREFDGLNDLLAHVHADLVAEAPPWARVYLIQCVFYPRLGFLTLVKASNETGELKPCYEGDGLSDDAWERKFVHDSNVYFKNRRMRELDERFPDLHFQIADMEIEILHALRMDILGHEEAILRASDLWGELDCLVAMAAVAEQHRLVAPTMTASTIIDIEGGRHLLQELVVPAFVANNCLLAGGSTDMNDRSSQISSSSRNEDDVDAPSILVLTGPNHSGKSVYLKQTALNVYLAHVGSFVPADRAEIGIVDRILTRVSTRESATRQESAFAIDLHQALFAMTSATRRSLVLIDEFGKGTNPIDGAALAATLFSHFAGLGANVRPKVLAATHFHEIFEHDFLAGTSPILRCAHMDIKVDHEAREQEEQVTFLYQLVPGRSTSSFGSRCAAMNGVDEEVVERAEAISILMARGEDLSVVCTRLSEDERKRLEDAEAIGRAFVAAGNGAYDPSTGAVEETDVPGESQRTMLDRVLGLAEDPMMELGRESSSVGPP